MSGRTGARYERHLRNALEANGFRCMRSPSSGAGTEHPQPDLLARGQGMTLCIELKYQEDDRIYLDGEEIDQLQEFARPWPDATCLIVARWKGDTNYYAVPVDSEVVAVTDSGRRRVKHRDVAEAAEQGLHGVRVFVAD